MLHNLHLRTLTRTTIIVCLPTSIKLANTKPVCATTYSVCTETGSCYGMQLCVADITTLQCVPELASMELYPEPQTLAQHSLPCLLMMTCTASVHSAISTFLSRSSTLTLVSIYPKIAQLCTDSPYHQSTSGDATCSDSHCQWQRSWMVHVQCRLHEQHKHSWSGTCSCRWPNQH